MYLRMFSVQWQPLCEGMRVLWDDFPWEVEHSCCTTMVFPGAALRVMECIDCHMTKHAADLCDNTCVEAVSVNTSKPMEWLQKHAAFHDIFLLFMTFILVWCSCYSVQVLQYLLHGSVAHSCHVAWYKMQGWAKVEVTANFDLIIKWIWMDG